MKHFKDEENEYIKTRLLSIDAWRDDEDWSWNNWFDVEEGIYFLPEVLNSPRKLLAYCRKCGWLTEQSKGKLAIDDDGYNVVIIDKDTLEPIYAFCYGEYQ